MQVYAGIYEDIRTLCVYISIHIYIYICANIHTYIQVMCRHMCLHTCIAKAVKLRQGRSLCCAMLIASRRRLSTRRTMLRCEKSDEGQQSPQCKELAGYDMLVLTKTAEGHSSFKRNHSNRQAFPTP